MHSVPNDETLTVKEALKQQGNPAKKNGERILTAISDLQGFRSNHVCFHSECLIKSLINPRNVAKMETTFGTWMKDSAHPNDERIWVAEHFSGEWV